MSKPIWINSNCVRPEHNGSKIEAGARGCVWPLLVVGHSKEPSKVAIAIPDPPKIAIRFLNQKEVDKIEPHPNQSVAAFRLPG